MVECDAGVAYNGLVLEWRRTLVWHLSLSCYSPFGLSWLVRSGVFCTSRRCAFLIGISQTHSEIKGLGGIGVFSQLVSRSRR